MSHINALSKNVNILTLENNSFDRNLVLSKDTDENIVKLREELEKKDDYLFEMRDGIVYRKIKDHV